MSVVIDRIKLKVAQTCVFYYNTDLICYNLTTLFFIIFSNHDLLYNTINFFMDYQKNALGI